MWKIYLITAGFVVFLLLACEKKIDFTLREGIPRLVVEATIENGQPPMVILTRSIGYFSELTPQLLVNNFVHGAEVTI
jgi:hypothetical protein